MIGVAWFSLAPTARAALVARDDVDSADVTFSWPLLVSSLDHVIDRGVVARQAREAVPSVVVGDLLERGLVRAPDALEQLRVRVAVAPVAVALRNLCQCCVGGHQGRERDGDDDSPRVGAARASPTPQRSAGHRAKSCTDPRPHVERRREVIDQDWRQGLRMVSGGNARATCPAETRRDDGIIEAAESVCGGCVCQTSRVAPR